MLNRNRVLTAFRQALEELKQKDHKRGLRPRTVALRAHEIYCETLSLIEKRPSPETFRKFATGQLPLPGLVEMLAEASIRPVPPTRLDRQKLRSVFEEAIQRLENRLMKGQARPLQIARRAYDLYTRDAAAPQPSRRTFEDLIYGKAADPEIVTLIADALKGKTES